MKIAVVTALAGITQKTENSELYPIEHDNADYYVFTDNDNLEIPNGWKLRKLFPYFVDEQFRHRRACRFVKQLTHYLLPSYDYYIWHDSTHMVNENPVSIAERLGDADMAFFEHPSQRGWDGEMLAASHRDHAGLGDFTLDYLNKLNIPKSLTLWETSSFIRKNNEKSNECFTLWGDLLSKLTSRDQVTLPAAIHLTNPKVSTLPGYCQNQNGGNDILPQRASSLHAQGYLK
jgi:hypothetical protein